MHYTSRNPRVVTRQMVVLHTESADAYALMVDLSKDGAMIEPSGKLTEGEEVTIEILDHKVSAKVAWASDGKIGLSFDGSLSAETVPTRKAKRRSRPGRKPRDRSRRPEAQVRRRHRASPPPLSRAGKGGLSPSGY